MVIVNSLLPASEMGLPELNTFYFSISISEKIVANIEDGLTPAFLTAPPTLVLPDAVEG